jgi:hypothetical protein
MLEILFLIWFCKKLASMARDKNRPGGWGALGALFWIGGEITGAVIGAKSSTYAETSSIYIYAIMGALLGALAAYIIVSTLKPVPRDGDLPAARLI